MTPRQTATLKVAQLMVYGLLAGILINAVFTYFTVEQIGVGFTAGMLAYMVKIVYDIELSRAEREAEGKQ